MGCSWAAASGVEQAGHIVSPRAQLVVLVTVVVVVVVEDDDD